MEILAGFLIAIVIALTGVGSGTITAPVLILFLGVPASVAVGTALAYSVVVRLIVAVAQIARKNVNYRLLGYMTLGGIPGVTAGALFFRSAAKGQHWAPLYWALGGIIVFSSSWHLYRHFFPAKAGGARKERPRWIAAIMLPIGAEVGFSSSGAGAVGTLALLSFTTLPAAQVVGTDVVFGLVLAVIGGGIHIAAGSYSAPVLMKLVIGGIAGAFLGSGIAPRVPNRPLKFALSAWLFIIGVQICLKAAHF
ncbi:MAG TPA: sulfite exporter TauE/SafE family protein [Terracidiphilus sp.]|nr:sulfite exporter TauE/SafE family protein [Terracidiphilus sp.]